MRYSGRLRPRGLRNAREVRNPVCPPMDAPHKDSRWTGVGEPVCVLALKLQEC
jgi:hypothetical protein